jgi:cyclophilin family peptidyl-prolyl cis-trans isomerase
VTSSFASLVRKQFFDGTSFHRIVPDFVIQGGDPTGTGTGGPGYTVRDVPPKNARYTKGVVAMAKTQAEPPGTAGSQFFVVTAPDAGLPPDYAILGTVTNGLKVVERIGRLGNPVTERPTRRVVVLHMTLV